MRHVNNLVPSKFRTGAENEKQQICYFNSNKKIGFLTGFSLLENKHLQVK